MIFWTLNSENPFLILIYEFEKFWKFKGSIFSWLVWIIFILSAIYPELIVMRWVADSWKVLLPSPKTVSQLRVFLSTCYCPCRSWQRSTQTNWALQSFSRCSNSNGGGFWTRRRRCLDAYYRLILFLIYMNYFHFLDYQFFKQTLSISRRSGWCFRQKLSHSISTLH